MQYPGTYYELWIQGSGSAIKYIGSGEPVSPNVMYEVPYRYRVRALLLGSVRDPKLIISDPDPQIGNQEFRIRILL